MGQTLTNGIYLPDEGERNSYSGLEANWRTLDALILTINGKAAPNVANTWTAAQTFTAGIAGDLTGNVTGNVTGDLTGTASRATADEDGNRIKSSYGKLASVNIWTTAQVFLNALRFNNVSYVSGTPSENIFYTTVQWGGYVNNTWSAPFTINNAIRTNGYSDTSFRTYSQTSNTLTGFVHETNADASDISFRPIANGTHNLGNSSYKWKTLNGVNPGALSLPDVSNAVSIDTTDWDKTGNLISYTPPVDGWISIITDNSSAANYIRCAYDNGDILAKANGNGYAQGLSVFLPVPKNVQVGIRLVCTTIGTAKLYPMLGNV